MADALGELKHRVQLQSRAGAANASTGGMDEVFTTIATVWARVEAIGNARYLAGQQVDGGAATHVVRVRDRDDYQDIKYVRWDGRRFRVSGSRPDDLDKRFREFTVEEMESGV